MAWAPPRSRPFGWYVARTMIPRTLVFLSLAAALLVGHVLDTEPLSARAADPAPVPTWTLADEAANPSCVPARSWRPGAPAAAVVVYPVGAAVGTRMPFDTAWARNHDADEGNDVWVVGICP